MEYPLKFTVCLLTRGDHVLMLHRRRPPNQGLWNGVGGRIEAGETPLACALREIEEETGYRLDTARFCGILTWEGFETPNGGLYIFTAPAPPGAARPNAEGELDWKPVPWLFSAAEVVSNWHVAGPPVLAGAPPQHYHFLYRAGLMVGHVIRPLPDDIKVE
jgi:8-oxo-dGTP diphosphatase